MDHVVPEIEPRTLACKNVLPSLVICLDPKNNSEVGFPLLTHQENIYSLSLGGGLYFKDF